MVTADTVAVALFELEDVGDTDALPEAVALGDVENTVVAEEEPVCDM